MGVLKKKRNNQARIEVSQTDQVQKFPLTAVWTFVRVVSSTLIRCGWMFISARLVENCISVERLNTLNNDFVVNLAQFVEHLCCITQIIIYKIGVLKNLVKFMGKHLCWNNFIKKTLQYRCFPVNFEKFLRTPFLQNTFGRLLK